MPPFAAAAPATNLAARVADRTAVERVYAAHRIGSKQAFEQILPPARVEELVRAEAKKEAVLQRVYKVTITPAQVESEVQRINATTQAPETLAEIKKALGDDPARFARAVARPILVERELRAHFDNDDNVHAPPRRLAEQARDAALAARTKGFDKQVAALQESKSGTVNPTIAWQLSPRPTTEANNTASAAGQPPVLPTTPTSAKVGSRSYSIEATAQAAQMLSPPGAPGKEREVQYFEDLPSELQRVLGVQLQKAGDVSAVIEMPHAFLVFVAKEKTPETLQAATLSLPKRSYEVWLGDQRDDG